MQAAVSEKVSTETVRTGDVSKFTVDRMKNEVERMNMYDQKVNSGPRHDFKVIPFCSTKTNVPSYPNRSPPPLLMKVPTVRFKPLTNYDSPEARTLASYYSDSDDSEFDQAMLERELIESERGLSLGESFDLAGSFLVS